MEGRRPFVHISYAQSLDGRIATRTGDSRYISSPETLRLAHEIRNECRAILVGIGTVLRDDPMLDCRLEEGCAQQPVRVVLDSQLRLPPDGKIAASARKQETLVYCAPPQNAEVKKREGVLRGLGIGVVPCSIESDGRLELASVLGDLLSRGIESVFVEGGREVITGFIARGFFDLLTVVVAPLLIGAGTDAVGDLGVVALSDARRLKTLWVRQIGADMAWRLAP